ncbi:MAG: hypothetical protein JXM73_18015 [Anaerolineae bacterium]|nr:hypothetical protein [Anaerolineae bacterium]
MIAYIVRSFTSSDRPGGRAIYGDDTALLNRYPRMADYLADEPSYFTGRGYTFLPTTR